jgi:PAS domain S-box-containing protein
VCPISSRTHSPHWPSDRFLERGRTDYHNIFEATPDPVVITRQSDWRIVLVNQAFCEVSGYTLDEAMGRTPLELGLWLDPDEIKRCVDMVSTMGRISNLAMTFRLKSDERPFLLSAAAVSYDGEDCYVSVARDITEQRKLQAQALTAQTQLAAQVAELERKQRLLEEEMVARERAEILRRQSEANLRKIFETSPEAITINRLDDGVFVETNEEFARNFGYKNSDVQGRSVMDLDGTNFLDQLK